MYHIPFHKHFKSCFLAANVSHCNEPVTTNTMFSNESALGSNAQSTQIFIGQNSKYIDVYGVATDHDLSHTLEENIMNHSTMDVGVLISHNAHAATSQKVKDILCMYCIKSQPVNHTINTQTMLNAVSGAYQRCRELCSHLYQCP